MIKKEGRRDIKMLQPSLKNMVSYKIKRMKASVNRANYLISRLVSPLLPYPGYFNKTLLHARIAKYSRHRLESLYRIRSPFARLISTAAGKTLRGDGGCWEFLNELQCTMSVRLITIVFIPEQPRLCTLSQCTTSHLLQLEFQGKYHRI